MAFYRDSMWAERPAGMRDVFPSQARRRRWIENELIAECEAREFELVSCGALEFVDTLLRGRETSELEDWVRFIDSSGKTVALRPEMTPSIARMAAPVIANGSDEVRWCYAERVYHRSDAPASLSWVSGRAAESTQMGVEFIGPKAQGHDADAQILKVCEAGLSRLGLRDWQVVLSHAQFTAMHLRACGFDETAVVSLLEYLVRGDYVGFRRHAQEHAPVSSMAGGTDVLSVLSQLDPFEPNALPCHVRTRWGNTEAGKATATLWEDMVQLAKILEHHGLRHQLTFDFTLARDLSYYTGVVFEVFAPGVAAPVALGGRYDSLLGQFGVDAPAIGFAYEVERLLAALDVSDAPGTTGTGEAPGITGPGDAPRTTGSNEASSVVQEDERA